MEHVIDRTAELVAEELVAEELVAEKLVAEKLVAENAEGLALSVFLRQTLDVGLLLPLVGYGLLRRKPFWRTCALFVAWSCAVLGPAAFALGYFAAGPVRFEILGQELALLPLAETLLAIGAALSVTAVAAWTLRVLSREEVKRQFAA